MRLPEDAEVSNELWDEVIECLKIRVGDKVSVVRTCAVRALSRFATDCENSDVLDLLLEALPREPSAVSFSIDKTSKRSLGLFIYEILICFLYLFYIVFYVI